MVEGTISGIGSIMLRRRASAELEQESHVWDSTGTPATSTSANLDVGQIESGHARNVGPQVDAMQNLPTMRDNVSSPFSAATLALTTGIFMELTLLL